MGIVNVTPDSFSDGGRYLDPAAAVDHGMQLASRGGGDPRHRRRVDPPGGRAGRRRGGAAPSGAGDRGPAGRRGRRAALGRHLQAAGRGGGARRRRHDRQRRDRIPRRPRDGRARRRPRRRLLPDAHARRAADDADRPRLRRRRQRGQGVPRGADGVRGRARACPRSGSCSTRESASARTSSTTSSCCAGSTSSSRSDARWSIGTSRKSFLGRLTGRAVDDRVAATIATNVLAYARGARVFRVHDVRARALTRWRSLLLRSPRHGSRRRRRRVRRRRRRRRRGGGALRARGDDRGERPVAVHARRRHRGRARGRPAAVAGPADRRRRVRRDGHRPDRGHGRLRRRCARWPTWSPSSAPTGRSSACARRSPIDCSISTTVHAVWVKAAKPEPPLPLPVSEVSVEVWREAE